MIKSTCFKTKDGQLHSSKRDADKHAQRLYDDKMTAILHLMTANEVVFTKDSIKFGEIVEKHLDMFLELAALKEDLEMEGDYE